MWIYLIWNWPATILAHNHTVNNNRNSKWTFFWCKICRLKNNAFVIFFKSYIRGPFLQYILQMFVNKKKILKNILQDENIKVFFNLLLISCLLLFFVRCTRLLHLCLEKWNIKALKTSCTLRKWSRADNGICLSHLNLVSMQWHFYLCCIFARFFARS